MQETKVQHEPGQTTAQSGGSKERPRKCVWVDMNPVRSEEIQRNAVLAASAAKPTLEYTRGDGRGSFTCFFGAGKECVRKGRAFLFRAKGSTGFRRLTC